MAVHIWEKTVRCIDVQNAGTRAVNGLYTLSGIIGGVSAYGKIGVWNEQEVEFSLYLFRGNFGAMWFISIIPQGMKPGTKKDIDFYKAPVCLKHGRLEQSDFPPERTWTITMKGHGVDPPPTIIWTS
mmetsp:Transcript_31145/g.47244  ORF Transcript_31145/g.47244 Transcript_31145/m.47244 type:complete len:127 (-) Transcript_31145:252-632(-)